MAHEMSRSCGECQGAMAPVIIMDQSPGIARHTVAIPLQYRLPDDRVSFWTGKYPTAGSVRAFMCESCGRIALYGAQPET
jgi:hypothetical protein